MLLILTDQSAEAYDLPVIVSSQTTTRLSGAQSKPPRNVVGVLAVLQRSLQLDRYCKPLPGLGSRQENEEYDEVHLSRHTCE